MKIALYYPGKADKFNIIADGLSSIGAITELAVLADTIKMKDGEFSKKIKFYDTMSDFMENSGAIFVNVGANVVSEEKQIIEKYKCENFGQSFVHVFKALRKLEKVRELCGELNKMKTKPLVFVFGCCMGEVVGYIAKTGAKTVGITGYSESEFTETFSIIEKNTKVTLAGTMDKVWLTDVKTQNGKSILSNIIKDAKDNKISLSDEQLQMVLAFGQLKAQKLCCTAESNQNDEMKVALAISGGSQCSLLCATSNVDDIVRDITPSGVVVASATIGKSGAIFSKNTIPLAARCLSLLEVGVQINTVNAATTELSNDIFITLALDNTINKQFSLDDIRKIMCELLAANKKTASLLMFKEVSSI